MRCVSAAFLFVTFGVATAGADSPSGRIWIDMETLPDKTDMTGVVDALKLRLPAWQVAPLPADADAATRCNEGGVRTYHIVVTQAGDESWLVTMYECEESNPLWKERVYMKKGRSAAHRKIAVLVGLTVSDDAPDEGAAEEDADSAADDTAIAAPIERRPVVGTIGLLPGFTAAPKSGQVVFSGFLDGGVLVREKWWVEVGFAPATPYKGEEDKNAKVEGTDIAISVQPYLFRLSFKYRLGISRRWWGAAGGAISYSHFVKKDLRDDKYAIEERSPAARGAVSPLLSVGFSPFSFLSIALAVSLDISFGQRAFKVRGEEAVSLGGLFVSTGLGVLFYL